jgi:hypothetical protein
LGFKGSTGTKWLRLKAGADCKYHPGFFRPNLKDGCPKENVDGLASIKFQHYGSGWESYACGQFRRRDNVSIEPFIGMDIKLFDKLILGVEAGIPHNSFMYEKFHWRYNKFETAERDNWNGPGKSLRGLVLIDLNGLNFGITAGYEEYNAEFMGEKTDVKNVTGGIYLSFPLD